MSTSLHNFTSPLLLFSVENFATTTVEDDHFSVNFCKPIKITPLIILAGIVGSGILILNILVVLAIAGGNPKFFRPMYWFIIHLSFSDIVVGLMLIWNYCLAAIFNISNTISSLAVLHGVWTTSASASVLGILLLAIDRYMQIVHRPLHSRIFTQHTVGLAIFLAWILPITIFLVIPFVLDWSCKHGCSCDESRYMECLPYADCSQVIPPFTKTCLLAGLIFLYSAMPWPLLIYISIFVKFRKSQQVLRHRMRPRDFRLVRTLAVIMLAFITSLTPALIVLTIDYFTVKGKPDTTLVNYALYTFVLFTLNSLMNPILYMWRISVIRKSLAKKLSCCKLSFSNSILPRRHVTCRGNVRSAPTSPKLAEQSSAKKKMAMFRFCDGNFPLNYSEDDSRDSTPMALRSYNDNKQGASFEMRTFSSRHPTSPLYNDSTRLEDRLVSRADQSKANPSTSLLFDHNEGDNSHQ